MRLLALTLVLCSLAGSAYATIPDPAFVETPLLNGLGTITGLGRAPDGTNRMFVIQKQGTVRVIEDGALLPATFATLTPIYTQSECGLIGMAFDPDFVTNHYVYFFVTVSNNEQQIQRYTDVNSVGMARTVVVPNLPTQGANHDGGGVGFGPDGKIYWSIGDQGGGTGVDADLSSLASKIGRANLDGSAPTDNPFYDGVGGNNDYIWARGFRNPFTMTFHPRSGLLISNTVGTSYEQVFVVRAGDHAGWNDYENNQPAGFITPIIAYRTNGVDTRTITQIVRTAGTLNVTTTATHRFRRGMRVTLAGVGDASMNGDVIVGDTPATDEFVALQAGVDSTSTGGTATNQGFGGAITGGTFYDSTSFAAAHRGAYFFGDYNSGMLMRASFDAQFQVEGVEVFGTDLGATVDAEVAPDGSLWVGELGGNIYQIDAVPVAQSLVVTPRNLRTVEGGGAALTVRLSMAPGAAVVVDATVSGDPDVSVVAGASLTFGPLDWDVPQAVVLATAFDGDAVADTATVTISSTGLASEDVLLQVRDQPQTLVLSGTQLTIVEGASGSFTVALSNPPGGNVTVTATTASADIVITQGTSLTFGPGDFSVPQVVSITANQDADLLNGVAVVTLSTPAAPGASVQVDTIDDDAPVVDGGEPDAEPLDAEPGDVAELDGGLPDTGLTPDGGFPNDAAPPQDSGQPADSGQPGRDAAVAIDTGVGTATGLSGGCGCSAAETNSSFAWWALLPLLISLERRRRR